MFDLFTLGKITLLALVNSLNPCQIAMLILVLVTLLIENSEKRKRIIVSGFAFIAAVYIGYLFYGIVLLQLFRASALILRQNAVYIKYFFSVLAMIVGALQIKDFFMYRPGSFATEMPIWMRSRAKRTIEKITSPVGAFFTGFIITLFLGPCTLAPLMTATQTLSQLGILGALPWLMYFNLIAVLPLIVITVIIYKGFATAENIAEWRTRNIRKLHLFAGLLLFGVGLAMLIGWI